MEPNILEATNLLNDPHNFNALKLIENFELLYRIRFPRIVNSNNNDYIVRTEIMQLIVSFIRFAHIIHIQISAMGLL